MNPSQLWETTMDPNRRNLIQLKIEDKEEVEKQFEILMGKDADKRKSFMETFELNLEDLDD